MYIEIRIAGQIDKHWSSWFEDLEISHNREQDQTLLGGAVIDQAALYGLLAKLRDLGLDLLSVQIDDPAIAADDTQPDNLDPEGTPPK